MKKTLLILSVLIMATAIIGCNKAPADPNAPVKLLVWCWDPAFNVYAMNEACGILGK
jgi:lactose/L-arabinose transport system substrate-binding protein